MLPEEILFVVVLNSSMRKPSRKAIKLLEHKLGRTTSLSLNIKLRFKIFGVYFHAQLEYAAEHKTAIS